jgi:DNA-binding NarL/FixJ family response regulator
MPLAEKEDTGLALAGVHFGGQKVLVVVEDGRVELQLAAPASPLVLRDVRVEARTPAHALVTLDAGGAYDLVIVDVELPRVTLADLRARLARFSPSIPLIVLHEEPTAPPSEAVREIGSRVLAELLARKRVAHVPAVASEDPALVRALAARDAFAAEVRAAVDEHHREGRDVVVERDGTLIRLSPPRT